MTVAAGLLLVLASGCVSTTRPDQPAMVVPDACEGESHVFLENNEARYHGAVERAKAWLDALSIDPIALRQQGIKGKKKLAEQLDAYYRLLRIVDPTEKASIRNRIEQVVAVTYKPEYHDMGKVSDAQFKEDATSYLRIALLMDRLALDTRTYREEIRAIQPRLDAQMKSRGSFQQATFGWYYTYFGLAEPFPLKDALQTGLIARRADPAKLGRMETYFLTHEIFVPFEYGEKLDADPYTEEDKRYLRNALDLLTEEYVSRRDPDIVAELVTCLRCLRFVDSPSFRFGLEYLLDNQNQDGSWGNLEKTLSTYGKTGIQRIILHTTTVSLDALTIAFHEPWNRDLFAGCAGPDRDATSTRSQDGLDERLPDEVAPGFGAPLADE
jgi:hypothetical protein